jgi:hypothetical protein
MARLTVLAILLVLAGSARAETALQATASCREVVKGLSPDGTLNFPPAGEYCWGAFAVVQQFSRLTIAPHGRERLLGMCVGEHVTRTQLVLVFLKYADNHPAHLDQEFPLIARQALMEAFPCK